MEIFIRDENILKYPELPIIDKESMEDTERHIGKFIIPIEKFEHLNVAFKRLGEQMHNCSFQQNKKYKGHKQPYKFHRNQLNF